LDCGTESVGILVSDSLMFQRGEPTPSDPHLGNVYGLMMPLVKRGLPVTPVQLENVTIPRYLAPFKVLLLSYDGQKPLTPEVHAPLVDWVRQGGVLVFCDKDADPYLNVHEWWNSNGEHYGTPREHLFRLLGLDNSTAPDDFHSVGKGGVLWLRERPADLSASVQGAAKVVTATQLAAKRAGLKWRETNCLLLRRGPYVIAAGLDESIDAPPRELHGTFVNLFDSELRVQHDIRIEPASRFFLIDLNAVGNGEPQLLASACKALPKGHDDKDFSWEVDGAEGTSGMLLFRTSKAPGCVTLDGQLAADYLYSEADKLLWVRFPNEATRRTVSLQLSIPDLRH
jgi:hypothetical protein